MRTDVQAPISRFRSVYLSPRARITLPPPFFSITKLTSLFSPWIACSYPGLFFHLRFLRVVTIYSSANDRRHSNLGSRVCLKATVTVSIVICPWICSAENSYLDVAHTIGKNTHKGLIGGIISHNPICPTWANH